MTNRIVELMIRDTVSAKVFLFSGSFFLVIYLTARNSGLYPMVFADEWLYGAYSRYMSIEGAARPSYLFYKLYGLTNYCGDAFLDCARQLNVVFFAVSLPLIYAVCRRFASVNLSVLVSLATVFSPINCYSAYFMPESMNFFFFWLFTWFVVSGYDSKPKVMAIGAGIALACMSLVKPHAVFLLPTLFVAFFSTWIFDRNLRIFKQASWLVATSVSAFILVRLPLGYLFAGPAGLSVMGSDYGGIASSVIGLEYFASLMPLAGYSLWGHLLSISILFGVPLALILQMPLKKSMECSDSDRRQRFLKVYTGSLFISLILIVAIFQAKAVSMGPYESIGRLSLRHYNFAFPLFLIVAASVLTSNANSTLTSFRMRLSSFALIGLVLYALVSKFSGFLPSLTDSPELRAITAYTPVFVVLTALGAICLMLAAFGRQQGVALYLLVFFPLVIITSAFNVSKDFSARLSPDVYDQAGQFANRYLGKDTAKLVIFGPDLASLYRTHFYMKTAETSFFAIPNGERLEAKTRPERQQSLLPGPAGGLKTLAGPDLIPDGKEWLLLIGNYQYLFEPLVKIHVPVTYPSGAVAGEYTLVKISHATGFQVDLNENTQHIIGKYDASSNSMVSTKGESGALLFGPYKQLQPGQYEATYVLTAESDVPGTVVGTLDVEGYIPPSVDDKLAEIPIRSAAGEQIIKLPFDAKNPSYQYQFRVWLNGKGGRVSIKNVNVKRL